MKKGNKLFILAVILLIIIISILIINYLNTPKKGEFKEITYNEIQEKLNNKESFVLVISQSTCSNCATYKPKVKIIAEDYGLNIFYIDIDLLENKDEVLKELKLSGSTPTTLFIQNGEEKSMLNRLEGDLSSKTVIKKLQELGFIET